MIKMKDSNLHRNPKNPAVRLLKNGKKAGRVVNTPDISAKVASVREGLIASRGEFAARAAKAKKSLPTTIHSVMLG
jgi:hypothetical protein